MYQPLVPDTQVAEERRHERGYTALTHIQQTYAQLGIHAQPLHNVHLSHALPLHDYQLINQFINHHLWLGRCNYNVSIQQIIYGHADERRAA